MTTKHLTLSLLAVSALASNTSFAEELTLDAIVVNADFREQNLSKVGAAVTVLTEDKIAGKSAANFEDVIGQVPNVNFTSGASRAHYIQIRGIGERSQFKSPVNPSVGLIVDGIDVSDSALALTMFDVKQIEVLKGPQGTTFGANGMAGVVSLQSNAPTKETQGHIETTVGNYNTKAYGAAVGGTLIEDKLLGRFSIYQNTSDGFIENDFLNRDDTQNIDELTAKAQLRLLAGENHTVDINLLHVDVDNGYDAFNFENGLTTYSDQPGQDAQQTDAIAVKSTYQIDETMHMVTKASYSQTDTTYSYDEDWSYEGQFSEDLYPYSSFDQYDRERQKVDFDVRVVSDKAGRIFNGTTDWTVGAYYKKQNEDLIRTYTYLDVPYTSSYDTKNMAIYGQIDSQIAEQFILTAGLRVEKWDAAFADNDGLNIDTDEVLVGGKLGLAYQQDANNLHYITLSKGYKPGGVNADNSLDLDARDFKTEHLWNIDMGRNSTFLEGALKTRINLFYGLRRDQQVKSSVVQVREDGSTDFIDYLANAAESHYYGLESQIDYMANDNLHVYASLGLLKSEFDDYTDPNPSSVDVNGRAPAQSPEYQYTVGFDYMLTDELSLKAEVEGKDAYYFSNRHNEMSDAYALINASLTYVTGDFTATLWGKNLTDEVYQTRGFGSFGNNPANGYETELYTQQGNPRTFGFTLGYDF
jgi:outer membrane receptor protein involved in Fe transport